MYCALRNRVPEATPPHGDNGVFAEQLMPGGGHINFNHFDRTKQKELSAVTTSTSVELGGSGSGTATCVFASQIDTKKPNRTAQELGMIWEEKYSQDSRFWPGWL